MILLQRVVIHSAEEIIHLYTFLISDVGAAPLMDERTTNMPRPLYNEWM